MKVKLDIIRWDREINKIDKMKSNDKATLHNSCQVACIQWYEDLYNYLNYESFFEKISWDRYAIGLLNLTTQLCYSFSRHKYYPQVMHRAVRKFYL